MDRLRIYALAVLTVLLNGCATLALHDAVQVTVAGLEPLPSEGLEARFAVKLRVQNPNDVAIAYEGIAVDLALADIAFGSGVSAERGKLGRFSETLITVPVTVPFTAIVRQLLDMANDKPRDKLSYHLTGRLGGAGIGGVRFDSRGELAFPEPRRNPD